jgi:acetyltransferase-like isoleucine patch superfamily enzyme
VVTKSVSPGAVVAGVPAKMLPVSDYSLRLTGGAP